MFIPTKFLITAALITGLACPAFAESASFQLSVIIPEHVVLPQAQPTPGLDQALRQDAAQIVQVQQMTRNDREVTVQSAVVL